MNNKGLETQIRDEIMALVNSRKSLMLSSLDEDGLPYASYAPFAVGDDCLYVLISEIAVHGRNLQSRHGERISNLSQLSDFKLFRLHPQGGRYVKGFGKAYQIEGGTLSGDSLSHLREGHKKRSQADVS